ncbi:MAG TPA: CHAT domain-containing protein [Pyrinomonadaceae bacterium]|nr:CHAT domain-containing protein [Pyrinomonadaceae bacterium]
MNLNHDEEKRVRSYLLSELTQESAQQLEVRLLEEDGFVEQVLMIEYDLIEDYARGELSVGERERFEKHFLTTPKRRRKLMTVEGLRKYAIAVKVGPESRTTRQPLWRNRLFAPWWKVAAFAALILLAGVGVWRGFFHQTQVERGLVALDQAYRQQRPLEARVTGLSYAPFSAQRGGEPAIVDNRARDLSSSLLLSAASDDPNPATLHALGRFYLTQKEFDKAIFQFKEALKASPDDAQILADLGATLLEQAKLLRDRDEDGKVMEKLAESQANLNTALRLKPSLLEASFNRALVLEEMMLPEQAREAWQSYLTLDPQSEWAKEAQHHLQDSSGRSGPPPTPSQLLESFVAAYRGRDEEQAWRVLSGNRELITRRMIAPQLAHDYASRALEGDDAQARESLRALLFAGDLDRRKGGDPYTAELAGYYAAASMSQLRLLSEAIKDLDSGYELCLATRYEEAARRFESARATFERVGDELEARLTDYWIAYCLAQPGHLQESNALLNALDEFCGKRGYKWLQAQAAGWLASNHTALNELSSAIKDYRRSLALAEEISDTYQMQKALMGLGDSYSRLRQPEASLGYHYRSLALASRSNATPRQSWRNFTYTGGALFAFKYYDAAAAFISEALRLATTEFNDPSLAYLQYLNLGLIYSKLRRFDDAVAQAEIGLRVARSVRDQKSSQKPIANALLRQADIRRESGDCGQAVAQYDQAISLYEGMELDLYRYAAYKGRLLCERALGDDTAVGRDLPVLLRLFEKQRTQIREEENRNSFFDAEQGVYDIAVEYEYERQNYLGALEYAEAARARSLLDAVRSGARIEMTMAGPEVAFGQVSTPADLESVRQHMPPRLQVLMYTVLPKKLLVWRISRDQFSVFQKAVSADVLGSDVNAYVNALTAERGGAVRPAATLGAKLFDTLLGPVIQTIKSGDVICIIPDKFLHRLSFAALISPDSGRYVVEDLAVFYAPSLNVLWHCSEASRKKAGSERGMVLSIGNPTFDPRAYPDLQPLRAAEREAREVADLYQRSSFLPGREATKARILRDINSAEVIHFAGHYVIEGSSPLLSKMLLAGGGGVSGSEGQDSDLFAFEIVRQRLDSTRLVVLSACQTGLDRYYDGEGTVGLARAFIEAGVPLVVASQWPVDSDATADLMVGFHRNRRSGLNTFEALRKAQSDMLLGSDESRKAPYYWAAFLCAGGYAEY